MKQRTLGSLIEGGSKQRNPTGGGVIMGRKQLEAGTLVLKVNLRKVDLAGGVGAQPKWHNVFEREVQRDAEGAGLRVMVKYVRSGAPFSLAEDKSLDAEAWAKKASLALEYACNGVCAVRLEQEAFKNNRKWEG